MARRQIFRRLCSEGRKRFCCGIRLWPFDRGRSPGGKANDDGETCRIKHRQATGHVEARGISRTSKASRDWLGISRILKRPSKMQVGPRTRRNLRALESFDFECSAADCIQSYVPAASLRIAADDIEEPDSLPGGPSARSALIFSASGLSMAVPFPRGTFKVDPGPGEHGVSVLFKPTQSTIVFSITSPGALATEYQVYHVNAAASVALAK